MTLTMLLKNMAALHSVPKRWLAGLGSGNSICKVWRLWVSRLRGYDQSALVRIDQVFDLLDAEADVNLRSLSLLVQLGQRGAVLPVIAQGEAAWQWHAQTVFLLALLEQPERWLT